VQQDGNVGNVLSSAAQDIYTADMSRDIASPKFVRPSVSKTSLQSWISNKRRTESDERSLNSQIRSNKRQLMDDEANVATRLPTMKALDQGKKKPKKALHQPLEYALTNLVYVFTLSRYIEQFRFKGGTDPSPYVHITEGNGPSASDLTQRYLHCF
jgi:hypothetical protein